MPEPIRPSTGGTHENAMRHGSLEYRPAIDGLRALAVLSVFVFHLKHRWLPGGFVGVDVFFVISGYLITSIIYQELQKGTFSLVRFYQRRIARIFPAFFTVALVTLAGAHFIYSPQDLASAGANLAAAALSIANLKLMTQGNYFEISPDAQPFLHYWSLSIEEQFYIGFPLFHLLLFKYFRKRLVLVLVGLWAASFAVCLVLTYTRPTWAFYLLPARAWELLAGCLLAVTTSTSGTTHETKKWKPVSWAFLALVILSFVLINEGLPFPGFSALLPVFATVGLLSPAAARMGSEKWLSTGLLVAIGRISYSLYLWHWPIFSLVDYHLCLASDAVRLSLKIALSFVAAIASYWLIEKPARAYLNRRGNVGTAYIAMTVAVVVCLFVGIRVHHANYVNADLKQVQHGGLKFHSKPSTKLVVLMGDSNGSMYGRVMKSICEELGYRLTVISVAAGDPLPDSSAAGDQLWQDSLAVIRRERPDCLVLACAWDSKLHERSERLDIAVAALRPLVGRLVLLNQPPILPDNANRVSIRAGARPPFIENAELHSRRSQANEYLKRFNSGNCSVVDIASHFERANGEVLFMDEQGKQLYHDRTHLSGFGADAIREDLKRAVLESAR